MNEAARNIYGMMDTIEHVWKPTARDGDTKPEYDNQYGGHWVNPFKRMWVWCIRAVLAARPPTAAPSAEIDGGSFEAISASFQELRRIVEYLMSQSQWLGIVH